MTQQSTAKENSDTNSHYDNVNRQTIGNRETIMWLKQLCFTFLKLLMYYVL